MTFITSCRQAKVIARRRFLHLASSRSVRQCLTDMNSPHVLDLAVLLRSKLQPRGDWTPADRQRDAALVRQRVATGFDRELLTHAIAGVNSGVEVLVGGNSPELRPTLLAFFDGEGSADGIFVGGGGPAQLPHDPAGSHAKPTGDRLLARPGLGGNDPQESCLGRIPCLARPEVSARYPNCGSSWICIPAFPRSGRVGSSCAAS
jgi:hypothetical protein